MDGDSTELRIRLASLAQRMGLSLEREAAIGCVTYIFWCLREGRRYELCMHAHDLQGISDSTLARVLVRRNWTLL